MGLKGQMGLKGMMGIGYEGTGLAGGVKFSIELRFHYQLII